ncbi:NAD(P)H-binding protein [Actinomadura sp. 9N407]|uniref:NAD(P)H-binding protein n=1 Tax=Actinomadura sp. 9N407 TaxID=3375154 RepID=UPI0037B5E331
MMILVFGATGNVGRHVVRGLLAAGEGVRAFTRDAAGAGLGPAVRVVQGDLGRPDTLPAAFDGVTGVVMISAGADAASHELAVAEAVRGHGVKRVVKLSSVAALRPVRDAYGAAHAAAERAFAETGAHVTALRAAAFMSNALQWRWSIPAGRIHQPYSDIPRALVDPMDVAAVAVACLTTGDHGDGAYQLTGPEALTGSEQAARISVVVGHRVECVRAEPERSRDGMVAAGLPAEYAEALLASLADPDPARGGTPLPTVRRILGRPPATFDDWLARHAGEFGG